MNHEQYMRRCFALAEKGAGYVAPNPMVGAVLVHNNRIIGEGFHQKYGEVHAEVNCIHSVKEEEKHLIPDATMYVSLEPCAHYGKTPPCTDLIIRNRIKKVVIGCLDPFKEVDGKGIEKLKSAGTDVVTGVLEKEAIEINRRFFIFYTQHRPYIILKWAETADGKIAALPESSQKGRTLEDSKSGRLHISNEHTNRLVHKWRSEEASIMVGTNTALLDDPELTTRLWQGPSPLRIVVDMDLSLPKSLKIFNGKVKTIVFNSLKHEEAENSFYYQVTTDVSLVHQVMNALYQQGIQSVMVEGGARLLQSFIDEGVWDEARVISNKQLSVGSGLPSPVLSHEIRISEEKIFSDIITFFRRSSA